LAFFIAYANSFALTRVPTLAFGMNPLGPNYLAIGFNKDTASAVAINFSNSNFPSFI
jgi:hypothetical protein